MELVFERGVQLPSFLTLRLPEGMRDELKRPLGPVVDEEQLATHLGSAGPVACVGDMTSETVHRLGHHSQLSIVDYQTKRSPDASWMEALAGVGEVMVFVRNEPATITSDLYNAIISSWTSRSTIKMVVDGEEDLAALPAILHAPEGATVIYGIPDTGLCLIHVDEGARGVVVDALERFSAHMGRAPP